jgi:hypothetical protein
MIDDRLGGLAFIAIGIVLIVFADAIGRTYARLFKLKPRPFQMINFLGGMLSILFGIIKVIFGI